MPSMQEEQKVYEQYSNERDVEMWTNEQSLLEAHYILTCENTVKTSSI